MPVGNEYHVCGRSFGLQKIVIRSSLVLSFKENPKIGQSQLLFIKTPSHGLTETTYKSSRAQQREQNKR